jgi:hypothetical protein
MEHGLKWMFRLQEQTLKWNKMKKRKLALKEKCLNQRGQSPAHQKQGDSILCCYLLANHRYICWFLFRKPKVEQATDKKPSTPVSNVPPDDYGCVFTPRAALGKITESPVYRSW